MKRKLWAIRELGSILGGYTALFFRAHLIWSVNTEEKTREARLADIRYQIDGTPLKYEQQKLERRFQRVGLALVYPIADKSLLNLERTLLPLGDPKAKELYERLEKLTLQRLIGDL